MHDNVGQFRRHFGCMLETYGEGDGLPGMVMGHFRRLRQGDISLEMLLDLAIEGCILFRKLPDAGREAQPVLRSSGDI